MHTPQTMTQTAYIAFGGNLGQPSETFRQALFMLAKHPAVSIKRTATPIVTPAAETSAAQPDYLNTVSEVVTTLTPTELLRLLLHVEQSLGRTRVTGQRNLPRTLDLDLLLYGDTVLDTPELRLPHPRMHLRDFVMIPLAEIAPGVVHPVLGVTVQEILHGLSHQADHQSSAQEVTQP